MTFLAALLFVVLTGMSVVLIGASVYYHRVLRPRLDASNGSPPSDKADDPDALASVLRQLEELARLREHGILTSKEFSTKKSGLLERI